MDWLPATSSGLTVEEVEWLPSGGATGLLRIRGLGGGSDRRRSPLPVLVVGAGEEATRHVSLPEPRAADGREGAWRGAYILRAELVEAGEKLALELEGGALVDVQAPVTRPAGGPRPERETAEPGERGGEVIERAVLAERRARRAEQAEQVQTRRAAEALKALEVLELRGAELERRIEELTQELAAGAATAGLRESLARSEVEVEELKGELASSHAAAADRSERQGIALAEALASAASLREAMRGWSARLRSAELARTSDAVRLAVLEAGRDATHSGLRSARTAVAERERELERLRDQASMAATAIEEAYGAAAEARQARQRAREEAEELRSQLDAARAQSEALRSELRRERLAGAALAAQLAGERRRREEADRRAREAQRPGAAPSPPSSGGPLGPGELAGRAGALGRAPGEPGGRPADPDRLQRDLDAAAVSLRARTPEEPVASARAPASVAASARPLREVMVDLARAEPATAARILAALLPAQGLRVRRRLDYDLSLDEVGTLGVRVAAGVVSVHRLPAPRSRLVVDFRIVGSALHLARLLAGSGPPLRRFRGSVRLLGLRPGRARDALAALEAGMPSLAQAARAGARLAPGDVLRALPYAIEPSWTRGRRFTVELEVTGEGGGRWTIAVDDGARVEVRPSAGPDPGASATVALSRETFDALLRDEPAPAERPRVRGDRASVGWLNAWTDRARGVAPAPADLGEPTS